MTKLKAAHSIAKIRPELVKQIHDKVIALCQKKYSSFEVDGLICITLLDTKEQQVVKIHKTLTSVTAEATKNAPLKNVPEKPRSTAYPSIAAMLVSDGESANNSDNPVERERDISSAERSGSDNQVYQNAIGRLNSLLKETSEMISDGSSDNVDITGQKNKKSKRKKKQPQQVLQGVSSEYTNNTGAMSGYSNGKDYDKYTDSVIIVKEEPVDYGFDVADSVQQPDKAPVDIPETSEGNSSESGNAPSMSAETRTEDHNEPIKQVVASNQNESNSVLDSNNETDEATQVDKDKQSGANKDSTEIDMPVPVSSYISAVIDNTIKSLENNTEDSANKKHSEWLYSLAQRSLMDSGSDSMSLMQRALIDNGNSARYNTPSAPVWTSKYGKWNKRKDPLERERGQQEPDPLGRSWFEMIQSNASKYQAALLREGKGTPVNRDTQPKPNANTNFDQLKDLLQKKQSESRPDETISTEENSSDQSQGAVEQTDTVKDGLDSDKSRSISPAPVVKIEVDEEAAMYPDINSGDPGPANKTDESGQTPTQKSSGKLESRYPALFNQLQQIRREGTPNRENDSLLNRLPFISFQEIFSQPGRSEASATPKASSGAGALVNLLNTPPNLGNSGPKKVWNWKKRAVRPKDKHGNIITYLPPGAQTLRDIQRKAVPKKRSKGDENDSDDAEWTPSSDKKAKISKQRVKSAEQPQTVEEPQTGGHCTRLSSGEKPRIDFAEIDVSDPEDDDPELINDEDDADNFELISAFCRYQCGRRFETFGELAEHESVCESKDTDVGNQVETEEDGLGDHKCDICGLEFNQEYRWQYHMVKVHGITVSTDPLFR